MYQGMKHPKTSWWPLEGSWGLLEDWRGWYCEALEIFVICNLFYGVFYLWASEGTIMLYNTSFRMFGLMKVILCTLSEQSVFGLGDVRGGGLWNWMRRDQSKARLSTSVGPTDINRRAVKRLKWVVGGLGFWYLASEQCARSFDS